jgi:hypothetical protein
MAEPCARAVVGGGVGDLTDHQLLQFMGRISHETSVVASPADRHATSDAATPSDTFEVSFVGPEPEREAEDAVEPTPAPAPAALPTPPASRQRLQFGKYRGRPDGRYGFMR